MECAHQEILVGVVVGRTRIQRMPVLSVLLLDLDGTLVDSEPCHIRAHETYLARQGMPCTAHDLLDNIGRGDGELYARLAERAGRTIDVAAWVREKGDVLLEMYQAGGLPAQPGGAELIDQAKVLGLACMLVTSSDRCLATAALTTVGLAERLPMRICYEDTVRHKPHPEPYLLAALRFNVPPVRCLVIEDSVSGTRAAVAAGMAVIAVHGLVSAEALIAAGAQRTVGSLRDLLPLAAVLP
jgi:HAD superfamily hydrolase (TIGR01509 family)